MEKNGLRAMRVANYKTNGEIVNVGDTRDDCEKLIKCESSNACRSDPGTVQDSYRSDVIDSVNEMQSQNWQ